MIEALSSGAPLVTSDRDPMRELAADAAILVSPENDDALLAALHALTKPDRQAALREKALARAGQLRASGMGEQTLAVYQCAAESVFGKRP